MSNFQSPHHTEQEIIAPIFRILCLHDEGSHASKLSDQLEDFGERLYENHAIDLVYVNSPLLLKESTRETPDRVWWEEQEEHKCVGLDASLLLLRQVWTSMPFWGILAVGKGAAVGSFLPLMPVSPMPAFCIFVNGETLLEEEQELLVDDLPCLHIVGESASHGESFVCVCVPDLYCLTRFVLLTL